MPRDTEIFGRAMKAIEPYLADVVVAGAWAHRLFRLHPLATKPEFDPLMTQDADVALPTSLRPKNQSIATLLTSAGFEESQTPIGESPIPRTAYSLRDVTGGTYVEFIAPKVGRESLPSGKPNDILSVAGVTATKLRYVELLLQSPWSLELRAQDGFDVGTQSLRINVANPGAYLAQKVLSIERRPSLVDRGKDALYVHDTVMLFSAALEDLRGQAEQSIAKLPAVTKSTFHTLRQSTFEKPGVLAHAARIAAASGRANPPSEGTISLVCLSGLSALFG